MDTQLLILQDNNQWMELDLFEDLSINVIIQETDITDVEAADPRIQRHLLYQELNIITISLNIIMRLMELVSIH